MSEPLNDKLREASWRRKLTASEEEALRAKLAAHPGEQAEWEAEARLTGMLQGLRDAPVPSNFTARVLRAVEQEQQSRTPQVSRRWRWTWRALLPKAALAGLAVTAGLLMYSQHAMARRLEMAQSVATVSEVSSLPGPEILKDFEAIRQLPPTPAPDDELLTLLK